MKPDTLKELEAAVKQGDGIVQASSVVIMSVDLYRDMLGLTTDDELAASVAALRRSMEEVKQGKARPLSEALDDLGRKYEVSS